MATKIALITGANKGIGKETARQLGHLGYHILLGSRDTERGQSAVEELVADGLSVELLPLAVTDPDSIDAAVKTVTEKFGHLDVLVNNAGVGIDFGVPASEGTEAATEAALPLSTGHSGETHLGCRRFHRRQSQRRAGRVPLPACVLAPAAPAPPAVAHPLAGAGALRAGAAGAAGAPPVRPGLRRVAGSI
jgi:NAD(P)-dependent dehydrogenase (short-subunit alcohol dehydrogenase family)